MIDINFEKILPFDEQIDLLFRLLVERRHTISRDRDVSFERAQGVRVIASLPGLVSG